MVHQLKAKHLTWRDGKPYLALRYPVKLAQHLKEVGKSQAYRKRLDVPDNATDAMILTALDRERERFKALCDGLWQSNRGQLSDVQAERSAMAYMSAQGVERGDADRIPYARLAKLEAEASAALQPSVAERVEALLRSHSEEEPILLLSDAVREYKLLNKDDRYFRVLDRFVDAVGDRVIDQSMNRHIFQHAQRERETRGSAAVGKDCRIILSALRRALKARGIGVVLYMPDMVTDKPKQRSILSRDELRAIFSEPMEPWLHQCFVLALTAGAINGEMMGIDPQACGHLDGCLVVRIDDSKTAARTRSCPIPYLKEWVPIPVGRRVLWRQMTLRIKAVNPEASQYSTRHTAMHQHKLSLVSEVATAQLMGFASRTRYAYGLGGAHSDELLRPLIPIQRQVWDWLLESKNC